MKLGVYFGWHVHPWEDLLALVQRAEELGYAAAVVDGDVSMLETRRDAEVLDGWTVTTALLAKTTRIRVGSIRLVHHWNAARLAQAAATAERLAPGRLRFQISIGDWATDARFGLPQPPVAERIAWLDETLDAVRALWRGESVSRDGPHVHLSEARVRPTPPGGRLPIVVSGKGPRLLEVVARHADTWDINLPPIPRRVEAAAGALARACQRGGRDPGEIRRSMLLFTRLGADEAGGRTAFRQLNPWFRTIPDEELGAALVLGGAGRCRERLAEIAAELRIDEPLMDLSGLPAGPARELLEALAPTK